MFDKANEAMKKEKRSIFIATQNERISKSMGFSKGEVEEAMRELDFKDIDEIWSESEASDHRVEQCEVDMDN